MNNILTFLTALALIICMYFFNKNWNETHCGGTKPIVEDTTPAATKPAAISPLLIRDGNKTVVNVKDDNLHWPKSSFEYRPLSDKVKKGLDKLAAYLKANPKKKLLITGLYGEDEKNNSASSTLGLARANKMRSYLTSLGADGNRIDVADKKIFNLKYKDGDVIGGLDYDFSEIKEEEPPKKPTVRPSAITLYFETAQSSVTMSDEDRKKFDKIMEYLSENTNAKVNVVGHTDNRGDDAMNMQLGQGRADFAKTYLVRNGIDNSRITASSKGEREPIADNNTEAGRAKNRRTVVTLN